MIEGNQQTSIPELLDLRAKIARVQHLSRIRNRGARGVQMFVDQHTGLLEPIGGRAEHHPAEVKMLALAASRAAWRAQYRLDVAFEMRVKAEIRRRGTADDGQF